MSNIKEVNALTGEEITIELTAAEIAELEAAYAAKLAQAKAVEDERLAAKQAILDRLGLTAEEAALLLT
jgi:hypothetical protein